MSDGDSIVKCFARQPSYNINTNCAGDSLLVEQLPHLAMFSSGIVVVVLIAG